MPATPAGRVDTVSWRNFRHLGQFGHRRTPQTPHRLPLRELIIHWMAPDCTENFCFVEGFFERNAEPRGRLESGPGTYRSRGSLGSSVVVPP